MSHKKADAYFHRIEHYFSQEYLEQFRDAREEELDEYQYQLGTMIRLRFLTNRSRLYQALLAHGYRNRDDMSMVIIRAYHAWAQEQ